MNCDKPRQKGQRSALLSGWRSDRGSVAASLIILPIVMLAILLVVHFSLVLHARNVATAAAQDGLRTAQLEGSNAAAGEAAAATTLDLFASISADVNVDRGNDYVVVTVTGSVTTPLNCLFNEFTIGAEGPVERFYEESERK